MAYGLQFDWYEFLQRPGFEKDPSFMTLACSKCESYWFTYGVLYTAQEMKFSTKDFFSKCDQIRKKLRIWSHLLKKSLVENFIFCAVIVKMK